MYKSYTSETVTSVLVVDLKETGLCRVVDESLDNFGLRKRRDEDEKKR